MESLRNAINNKKQGNITTFNIQFDNVSGFQQTNFVAEKNICIITSQKTTTMTDQNKIQHTKNMTKYF